MTADTKECLFCAETIKVAAKKCRFCGEWLDSHTREPTLHDETIEPDKIGGDKISTGNISDVKGAAIGRESQAAVTGDDSIIAQTKDGKIEITLGKKLYYDILVQICNILKQKFRPPSMEEHRLTDLKTRTIRALENTETLQRIMGNQWANEYRSIIMDAIRTSLKMSKRDMKAELSELKRRAVRGLPRVFLKTGVKKATLLKILIN